MNSITADVIVGLQYGDEGKGKVTHSLLGTEKYTHCLRYNGSANAGHTIYHDNKKIVLHCVPAGVLYGIKSIIGPGCVLDVNKFLEEVEMLNNNGINTEGVLFVDKRVHLIQIHHKVEDSKDVIIGTTKSGNGQSYRDKYGRHGVRFGERQKWLNKRQIMMLVGCDIDVYEELHNNKNDVVVLCEGAQGFGLDIDWGDYPFVTSSHCTTGSALLNCIPWHSVRNVYGVAKAYETYVGAKKFQPEDSLVLEQIQELGNEFGATTGRVRQCNWINLDMLKKSCQINGVNQLIINKCDIVKQAMPIHYYQNEKLGTCNNFGEFVRVIESSLRDINANITYSQSRYKI